MEITNDIDEEPSQDRISQHDKNNAELEGKPDAKRIKAQTSHEQSIYNLPESSRAHSNSANTFLLDKGVLMAETQSSVVTEGEPLAPLQSTEKQEDPLSTLADRNSSNSNFLVYMDNGTGSPVLSQVVSRNILQSSEELSQINTCTRNMVSSQLSYFDGNILEDDKMRSSIHLSEQPVTVVFDPAQQHQEQIYIDSSSLVDVNQSVVIPPSASVKDGNQSLTQVLVTTHNVQEMASNDNSFHTILMASEELNNSQSNNDINYLPLTAVHWEDEKAFVQEGAQNSSDKTNLKDLVEMKEQRQADLRNLEQSHLAHQITLIQQRKKKDNVIRKSSLEDHLKDFGIDDTTPIFSSITAKLNPLIVTHVPGCQQFLLKDSTSCARASSESLSVDAEFSFKGNISELVSMHNSIKSLMHLKSQTNVSYQIIGQDSDQKEDKSIYCNLLVPYISSKGRISKQSMKAKQAETLSRLDYELLNGDNANVDENYKSPRKTWRTRLALHKRNRRRLGSKKIGKTYSLRSQQESQSAVISNSIVDDEEKNHTVSTSEENPTGGNSNVSSVDADLNDPLQVRLRQEQIKYRQIVDSTNKMRQLKSALIESSIRTSLTEGLSDDLLDKETTEKSSQDTPKRIRGRPPKQLDPSESRAKVTPRNPWTESESTKQQRIYEEHVSFKFFCNKCSFKTKRKSHFDNHMQCHKKYPEVHHCCDKCDFVSISLPALSRHELEHKKNLLRCEICSYKTDQKKLMQRHIRMKHTFLDDEPRFPCDQCSTTFSSITRLTRHQAKHAKSLKEEPDETKFVCNQCSKDFRQRIHLHRHVRDVHGPEVRPHLCDKCGKSFKRTDALQQHKLVHVSRSARKLPHKCDQCNKGFRSQAHLKEHMSMHTTERPYLCHFCGAAFKTQPVQKRHILTLHIRPRTHVCSLCCRQFNTKTALMKHENTHRPSDSSLAEGDKTTDKNEEPKSGVKENAGVMSVNVTKTPGTSLDGHPLASTLPVVVDIGSGRRVVIDRDGNLTSSSISDILRLDPLMHQVHQGSQHVDP